MYAFVKRTAVALLAAGAVTGLGAVPALAAEGDVTWTVRTASNSYGADRSSFSYAVNPGGTVSDAMIVANRGKTPVELGVYPADGFTTGTGRLDLRPKDQKATGIGTWVHATDGRVTVAPGRTVSVPFKVTVPGNATPGDYVGGIVTSLTRADQAQGINVERRLGIRIKLRVGGALTPGLAIEHLHVDYHGPFSGRGDATVTYSIHNTGNAVQSAQQTVSVAGPFGLLRVPAATITAPPELLPGESWKVTVPVHGVSPTVRLAATATLTPLITDASGSRTALKPVSSTTHGWALPWALLVLVVILVAAFFGARAQRRRAKTREDARVQEAVEKALREKDPAQV
jgi:hypothetical protein